jgi:pimeloyl-ACP methyl ester carboxylesterase
MQPSTDSPPLEALQIATPSGPLEVFACLPQLPRTRQPLLFVHGAHGSAACFNAILPLIARAGYACYALSLRGHGKSWQPSAFAFHALTGIGSYVADVGAAMSYLATEHPDAAPVLVGHSMGGGVLQRALVVWEAQQTRRPDVAGLVLLASAPLSGGGLDVARNWQAAEAALAQTQPVAAPVPPQAWLPWLRSFVALDVNTGINTPTQVRNKFFSPEATDDVVRGWLRDSKSRLESIRVSLEVFWPLAEPTAVLAAIGNDSPPIGRKVLCISAEKDVLISSEVSQKNYDAYRSVSQGEEDVLRAELPGSAHHVMLDVARERCADIIVKWVQGGSV